MVWQFKKFFPIFLSLLLGVVIVVIAAKRGGVIHFYNSSDTSKEGTDDSWKSTLSIVPGAKNIARVERGDVRGSEPSPYATTTTDLISKKLIFEYIAFQRRSATTTLSEADAKDIAVNLVREVQLAPSTQYSLRNLNISGDNSNTAIDTYTRNVSGIIQEFSSAQTTNEITIVKDALSKNDAQRLQGLTHIIAAYENLKKDLLAVKVPSTVAPLHLRLIQTYTNMQSAIVSMQKMFSDSIQGFAAIAQYEKELDAVDELAADYRNYMSSRQ